MLREEPGQVVHAGNVGMRISDEVEKEILRFGRQRFHLGIGPKRTIDGSIHAARRPLGCGPGRFDPGFTFRNGGASAVARSSVGLNPAPTPRDAKL